MTARIHRAAALQVLAVALILFTTTIAAGMPLGLVVLEVPLLWVLAFVWAGARPAPMATYRRR